jgi:hypothetical protein
MGDDLWILDADDDLAPKIGTAKNLRPVAGEHHASLLTLFLHRHLIANPELGIPGIVSLEAAGTA